METIITETKKNTNLVSNIDNFRSRYMEIDYDTGITVLFPSTEIYTYEHNLFRLLAESDQKKFTPRWEMRPDYASYDLYGSTIHWQLLLFVNSIHSIEDFKNLEYIFAPPLYLINKLVKDRVSKDDIYLINKKQDEFNNMFRMFARRERENTEYDKIATAENITEMNQNDALLESMQVATIEEKDDIFVLDEDDITDKLLTLSESPISISSVSLFVNNLSIPQKYGFDYVLKYDSNSEPRIVSWLDTDVTGGKSNMKYILSVGDEIHVKYVYEIDHTA